jgi:hypothetical protein
MLVLSLSAQGYEAGTTHLLISYFSARLEDRRFLSAGGLTPADAIGSLRKSTQQTKPKKNTRACRNENDSAGLGQLTAGHGHSAA